MNKYPKIGIRPTIDGRQGGVRESLEDKTMSLAQAVADLISSHVKYSDGTPVECVIADGTIGRVGESAACAEKFEREGVGATITVTSGREPYIWQPYWPDMPKKDCPHSASTGMTYRIWMTIPFRPT